MSFVIKLWKSLCYSAAFFPKNFMFDKLLVISSACSKRVASNFLCAVFQERCVPGNARMILLILQFGNEESRSVWINFVHATDFNPDLTCVFWNGVVQVWNPTLLPVSVIATTAWTHTVYWTGLWYFWPRNLLECRQVFSHHLWILSKSSFRAPEIFHIFWNWDQFGQQTFCALRRGGNEANGPSNFYPGRITGSEWAALRLCPFLVLACEFAQKSLMSGVNRACWTVPLRDKAEETLQFSGQLETEVACLPNCLIRWETVTTKCHRSVVGKLARKDSVYSARDKIVICWDTLCLIVTVSFRIGNLDNFSLCLQNQDLNAEMRTCVCLVFVNFYAAESLIKNLSIQIAVVQSLMSEFTTDCLHCAWGRGTIWTQTSTTRKKPRSLACTVVEWLVILTLDSACVTFSLNIVKTDLLMATTNEISFVQRNEWLVNCFGICIFLGCKWQNDLFWATFAFCRNSCGGWVCVKRNFKSMSGCMHFVGGGRSQADFGSEETFHRLAACSKIHGCQVVAQPMNSWHFAEKSKDALAQVLKCFTFVFRHLLHCKTVVLPSLEWEAGVVRAIRISVSQS